MSSTTHRVRAPGSLVSALALLALTGCGVTREFHDTYALAPGGRVILDNATGGTRIIGWDRDEVIVSAVSHAYSERRLAEAEIQVESGPDSIRLWTEYPPGPDPATGNSLLRSGGAARVAYILTVPRYANLERIEVVSGDLIITGFRGSIRARTRDGDIIAVFDRLDDPKSAIMLESLNGEVSLQLPMRPDIRLDAHTRGGNITSDIGIPVRTALPSGIVLSDLREVLGTGRVRVRVNTVSGDIEIREASGF